MELGAGEKEVSKCINCEGAGSITCTTCQGSGFQPRYLDRRFVISTLYIALLYCPSHLGCEKYLWQMLLP